MDNIINIVFSSCGDILNWLPSKFVGLQMVKYSIIIPENPVRLSHQICYIYKNKTNMRGMEEFIFIDFNTHRHMHFIAYLHNLNLMDKLKEFVKMAVKIPFGACPYCNKK